MSKGVLLFAHNNKVFDYHKLVVPCAFYVKKHLGVTVAVATDSETQAMIEQIDGWDTVIDQFVPVDHPEENGKRNYHTHDGDMDAVQPGEFRNKTRIDMYELTPFEETIYMDLDYIVMDDSLNRVWGSEAPVRMNHDIVAMTAKHSSNETHVHPLGITMYWSTVMYFRKSEEAKAMFDGVRYIKDNYRYFARVYRFYPNLFRNDIALSIMAHCLNGGSGVHGARPVVQSLPEPTLLFAWDDQPLLKVDVSRMWFVASGRGEDTVKVPAMIRDQSVHIVNKSSLLKVLYPYVMDQIGGDA